jgi:toxin-antitoxin system PIN domain toxin
VILLDANLLLYAYNADAPQQQAASGWLTEALESADTIGLPMPTIWAFVRISTSIRLWKNPLTSDQAFSIIDEWLSQPGVVVVQAGPRHLELLKELMSEFDAIGALVSDAVLAALALEFGATLASTDQDFRRFPSVRWTNPLKR